MCSAELQRQSRHISEQTFRQRFSQTVLIMKSCLRVHLRSLTACDIISSESMQQMASTCCASSVTIFYEVTRVLLVNDSCFVTTVCQGFGRDLTQKSQIQSMIYGLVNSMRCLGTFLNSFCELFWPLYQPVV